MSRLELWWNGTSYAADIIQLIFVAACLIIYVLPYLWERKKAFGVGIVYLAVMVFLYRLPVQVNNFFAYFAGILAVFIVMCIEDRKNINQKIFLSVTFFSLCELSSALAGKIDSLFFEPLIMSEKIAAMKWLWYGVYVSVRILNIFLCTLFLYLSVRTVNRTYESKNRYMGIRELLLLIVPSLSKVIGSAIFRFYQVKSGMAGIYDVLCILYYLISITAILVMIFVFQSLKTSQEEQSDRELIASQINDMKIHIEGVERLYSDIRSMRHDMGNHIQVLERLIGTENSGEARTYLERLSDEWKELTPEIKTGNPVTDIILLEKKKEAEKAGIAFCCDFHYPENTKLNAFDLSVILYNALNNCMESANGDKPYIRIYSFHQNSVYTLIIRNSFQGKLYIDSESGLPFTTKKSGEHGIGLKNIRRVARKYMGDVSFEQRDGEVIVSIMLQIK